MFHGAADGDDGPFQLASASGWTAFARWADTFEDYPAVKTLANEGHVEDSSVLSDQLADTLLYHPPGNDVADTVEQLLEKLGAGDPFESVTVISEDVGDSHPTGNAKDALGHGSEKHDTSSIVARVKELEALANTRTGKSESEEWDDLESHLEHLDLKSMTVSRLKEVCNGLGISTGSKGKGQLVDVIRRVPLERHAQRNSANS